MEFRYDFHLDNRMLSIYDAAKNEVYITRSFTMMNTFTALVSFNDNEAALDDSIDRFMSLYRVYMIRVKQQ